MGAHPRTVLAKEVTDCRSPRPVASDLTLANIDYRDRCRAESSASSSLYMLRKVVALASMSLAKLGLVPAFSSFA